MVCTEYTHKEKKISEVIVESEENIEERTFDYWWWN